MLTVEENRYLTAVGRDTPMGKFLRRFWIPAVLAAELPAPDSDPVRVRLLGENYVAFRDSDGRVGILDEYCTHRGASLALGRCEGGGLRCLYHGWKFGVDGTIMETPNVRGNRVRERLRAPAYPTQEMGGVIWVYLGPIDTKPSLPNFPFMQVPPEHRDMHRIVLNANWVQIVESGIDESHAGILHQSTAPFGALAS